MRIRRFRDSDAVQLARLHRSTIRNVNSKDYPQHHIRVWASRVSAHKFRTSASDHERFVALEKGKIIGFAEYKNNDLMGLYIHKDYTGTGVGKKLLQRLEADAYNHGIRTLNCSSTITAHRFYEKNGYTTIKKAMFTMGRHRLKVFEMKKRLSKKDLTKR